MRRLIIGCLFFLLVVCGASASIGSIQIENLAPIGMTMELQGLAQQRGCCSWHGGVCGCDGATGRTVCCDGTLSPSCT